MPRAKRNKPNDLKTIHDRRTHDLLRNAQVAPIEVDCPIEPGGTLIVMRSIRNDPLANLHDRKFIDDAQYWGARSFQHDFERVEQGPQAVDSSKPYVDCSRNPQPLPMGFSEALARLNRAERSLGPDGSALVHAFLIHSMSYRKIAESRGMPGKRWEEYFGMRVHECLHRLSYAYGFATEETGKRRIEVRPNFVG